MHRSVHSNPIKMPIKMGIVCALWVDLFLHCVQHIWSWHWSPDACLLLEYSNITSSSADRKNIYEILCKYIATFLFGFRSRSWRFERRWRHQGKLFPWKLDWILYFQPQGQVAGVSLVSIWSSHELRSSHGVLRQTRYRLWSYTPIISMSAPLSNKSVYDGFSIAFMSWSFLYSCIT